MDDGPGREKERVRDGEARLLLEYQTRMAVYTVNLMHKLWLKEGGWNSRL